MKHDSSSNLKSKTNPTEAEHCFFFFQNDDGLTPCVLSIEFHLGFFVKSFVPYAQQPQLPLAIFLRSG